MGGSRKWDKMRHALGLSNLCMFIPKDDVSVDDDDDDSSPTTRSHPDSVSASANSVASAKSDSRHSGPLMPRNLSTRLLSKNSSRSSKKTCTICLGSMNKGNGHALFTAECAHTFHFNCIVANVKHGNNLCPVCRSEWKEIPFQAPHPSHAASDVLIHHGRQPSRVNPVNYPGEEFQAAIARRVIRANSAGRHTGISNLLHISEPASFDDDESPQTQHQLGEASKNVETGCASTKMVDVKTYTEFSAVQKSDSRDNFTVLINLKAPITSVPTTPPATTLQDSRVSVDIVTVLDVSGSMAGTKLTLLKRAMEFVIQNLGPSDRLSVIAFASTARRLFHLRLMNESGRQQALLAVNSLVSSGGTNIAEGLKKGMKVLDERREKNPVCSIVLLSDGQDTYTVTSTRGGRLNPNSTTTTTDYNLLLPASIRGRTDHHTPVHAFGFGTDHDSALMHSISETSGGTFSFIETEVVIQDAFAQCIGGLLSVVVQDVHVKVDCAQDGVYIKSIKAGSYTSDVAGERRNGTVDIGDLYADEERDFLVSVNVPADEEEADTMLLKVNCTYKDPFSDEAIHVNTKNIVIQRPEHIVEFQQITSIEVDRQLNRFHAAEAMASARSSAERGAFAEAMSILEECRQLLVDSPAGQSGDRFCVALIVELKEMQERMVNRRRYEASGRAYVLSGLSSHSWQRATARGDSTESHSLVQSYQTPSMADMLQRSQTLIPTSQNPDPNPTPSVKPPRSFQRRAK